MKEPSAQIRTTSVREIVAAALYADTCTGYPDMRTWAEMTAEHPADYEGVTRFYSRADAALNALAISGYLIVKELPHAD